MEGSLGAKRQVVRTDPYLVLRVRAVRPLIGERGLGEGLAFRIGGEPHSILDLLSERRTVTRRRA